MIGLFLYLPSPGGGEECFHQYGGLGLSIFLYLFSPRGGEEYFLEYGGLGPWIFH